MALLKFRNLIETFEFGAQFSVFSGFSLVTTAMDDNSTLQQLIEEVRTSRRKRTILFKRIRRLLREQRAGNQSASDGSIAAYLYCLWQADLETGYRASLETLNTPGLWWSAKLALLVRKQYIARQISNSIQFTSDGDGSVQYTLSGRERSFFEDSQEYKIETIQDTQSQRASQEYRYGSTENTGPIRETQLSTTSVYIPTNVLNPEQELELKVAV